MLGIYHEVSPVSRFPRIVVSSDEDLTHDEVMLSYAEEAVKVADLLKLPVHLQDTREITRMIFFPDR